ncbi:MAG: hypothetical protein QW465_00965 [Candidatus Anstonellales archaeon]
MQVQLEEGEKIDMKTEPTIPSGLGNHSVGGNNSFSIGNSLQSVTGDLTNDDNNNFSVARSVDLSLGDPSLFPSNKSYRSFLGGHHKLPWEDQDFYNFSIAGYYYNNYSLGDPSLSSTSMNFLKNPYNDNNQESIRFTVQQLAEEIKELLEAWYRRAEEQDAKNSMWGQEESDRSRTMQLAERIHRLKEILYGFDISPSLNRYVTLQHVLGTLAEQDPETYGKLVESLNNLFREIQENEEFRARIVGQLEQEDLTLLFVLGFATARTGDDWNNVSGAAQMFGLAPSNVYEDIFGHPIESLPLSVQEIPTTPELTGQREQSYQDSNDNVAGTANKIEIKGTDKLNIDINNLRDQYSSDPYVAHMLDAFAALMIAKGKLDLPPESGIRLGEWLISNLENNQTLQEEFKAFVVASPELQKRLNLNIEDLKKEIDKAHEEREKIIKRMVEKHPDEPVLKEIFV